MRNISFIFSLFLMLIFSGCASTKSSYNPDKKFSREELQEDFMVWRNILEKKHPALYWYTTKDSMDQYFDKALKNISDSMTELQFGWNIISPITHVIRCGHTSVSMSKKWEKYIKNKRMPSFPLYVKVWGDTMVVTANLNRKDSVIKRGTLITSVNGYRNHEIIKYIFNCLPLDGYSDNVNYVRISNNFPYFHRNVFGLFNTYSVGYIDSSGYEQKAIIPMYIPEKDSGRAKKIIPAAEKSRKERLKERNETYRSFSIDTSIQTGIITLNTFNKGKRKHLRSFFRNTFRKIESQKLKSVILDIRSNGGGDVGISVLLTKYLRHTPFKVADSAYAISKSLRPFTGKIKHGFLNNLGLFFFTKKHSDGNYHFGYWERHYFKPKIKNHFNGSLYVLTSGPTFSASTLFCNAVKGQNNVKLVGEETGGGWYGNSGIMIPDVVLPHTKLRVRLPLFRIVQYDHVMQKGTGVIPDIYITPTVEGVRKGIDRKMLLTKEMIRKNTTKY